MDLSGDFARSLAQRWPPVSDELFTSIMSSLGMKPVDDVAVAVSGGSDSVALALLLTRWVRLSPRPLGAPRGRLIAIVVDHGLRPESAAEAELTRGWLVNMGVDRVVVRRLDWEQRPPQGKLEAQARQRRYDALVEVCREEHVRALACGHQLHDNAETLLLRLFRLSGLRGLAGIAPASMLECSSWSVALLRPLLQVRKENLMATCVLHGQPWVTDPSNFDDRLDRVRVRNALRQMEAVAAGPDGQHLPVKHDLLASIGQLVGSLQSLRLVLDGYVQQSLRRCAAFVHPFSVSYVNVAVLTSEELPVQVAVMCGVFVRLGLPYDSLPSPSALESLLSQVRSGPMPSPWTVGHLRVAEVEPDGPELAPARLLRVFRPVFPDSTRDLVNSPLVMRPPPVAAPPAPRRPSFSPPTLKLLPQVRKAVWDDRYAITLSVQPRTRLYDQPLFVRPLMLADRKEVTTKAVLVSRRAKQGLPLFVLDRRNRVMPHRLRASYLVPRDLYESGLPVVVDESGRVVALPHFPALVLEDGIFASSTSAVGSDTLSGSALLDRVLGDR